MDRERYEYLKSELLGLIDRDEFSEALQVSRKDARVDTIQNIMRSVVRRSSLGCYAGVTYHFGGMIYEPLSYDEFSNVLYDVMFELGMRNGDYGRIDNVVRTCRRIVRSKALRISKGVMVFRNGVYDIERGVMEGFSPRYVQFSYADYDYDPEASGYIWDVFLEEVLPNKVHRVILQEFLGSLFVDRAVAKMETLMVLKGSGANGKSVIFDTVVGILGKENVSNFGLDELIGGGLERKRNIATMNGKRLNYASESGSFVIDGGSGMLKAIISGEPVEARPMYGSNFSACDIPLIMINTNHMPTLKDFSQGLRRRLCIIPFDVEIHRDRQDKELSNRLRSEYSYIFNWILEGRKRFIARGYKLTESYEIERLLDEYQFLHSTVLAFMGSSGYERSSLRHEPPVWVPIADLYGKYCNWCRRNCEVIEPRRKFSVQLLEAGYRRATKQNIVCYAMYGPAAYEESLRINKELQVVRRKEEEKMTKGKQELFNKVRIDVKERYGWKRVAVGEDELVAYIGYTVSIQSQIRQGFLDGCYVISEGINVYNLDLIDTLWRPAYEDRAREMMGRLELGRERKRLIEDYNNADIGDLLSLENTGDATQQHLE